MTAAAAAPRRRRWPWIVMIIAVVLGVLLTGAELIARSVVPSTVRSLVIDGLDLPADQQIDVQVAGMMLPQLITGSLDEVALHSDEVTIGGLTGAAHVEATGVPVHGGELGSANGTVSIDQMQFETLLAHSELPVSGVKLHAPDATVQGGIRVFGREIPLALTVTPAVDDGDLLLTPVSVSLGGMQVDLQRLAALLGDIGEGLAAEQRICIADHLPAGITLTGLRIEGTRAVADISAASAISTDPALLEPGTCPR